MLGLVLMGALVAHVGVGTIATMIAQVGWSFITIVALYAVHSICRALVLWIALDRHRVPFVDVLRIRFSGEAVEALTYTGPLLAEPAKGLLLTNRGVPAVNAFAAISIEYLLYSVAAAVFGAIAAVGLMRVAMPPPGLHSAALALLLAMLAFIGATIVAAVTGVGLIAPSLRGMNALLRHPRVASAIASVAEVEHLLVDFLHTRPQRLALSVGVEMLSHALLVAEVWVMLRSIGIDAEGHDVLIIEGSAKLVAFVFFFVPAQLGVNEGGNALVFPLLGLPVAAGLAVALVRRIRSVCIAAIGVAAGSTLR